VSLKSFVSPHEGIDVVALELIKQFTK